MPDYTNLKRAGAFSGADIYARAHNESRKEALVKLVKIPAYALHQPARRKKFVRRQVLVDRPGRILGMDLVDLGRHRSKNNLRQKYILIVIDLFSRFVWLESTSAKSGPKVTAALEKILKRCGCRPEKIHSDFGKEFYNSQMTAMLRKRGIELYSTTTGVKVSIAERAIRTLFGIISRYLTENKTNRFVDKLRYFEKLINNSYHRSIGMSPSQVTEETRKAVYERLYERRVPPPYKKPKFVVGDSVLAVKSKGVFDKGYTANYQSEPYRIIQVLAAPPQAYMCQRGDIVNFFYEAELVKNELGQSGKGFEIRKRWYG
jgi:transposase InsO family protein